MLFWVRRSALANATHTQTPTTPHTQNKKKTKSVVLLHGPPGTGKTSLCKALAQKLAIVHADRYPAGATLVEVNAHSLFSKWFSESGKLVSKLFSKIHELLEDEEGGLVIVLIDEVESLAAARQVSSVVLWV